MKKSNKIELFRELLDSCTIVKDDSCDEVGSMLNNAKSTKIVSFLNFHAINISIKNNSFYRALKEADFFYRDGVGVEVALKVVGHESGLNMNGTDFIPKVIQGGIDRGIPFIFWGTETKYLLQTKKVVEDMGGVVANILDGFQTYESYINKLKELKLDNAIIILGMGMPKQELLSSLLKEKYPAGYTVINGGAIIDFIAKRHPRAPLILRKIKLEFLYRLFKEPKRLWRRTILGGLNFLLLTGLLFFCNSKKN